MKKFLSFIFTASSFLLVAQNQALNIEDAIRRYQKTANGYQALYPENIYGLQWIENTNNYIFNNRSGLEIVSAQGEKIKSISGMELAGNYPSLRYIPQIELINEKELVFQLENAFHCYDYNNNKNNSTILLPKTAENADFNPHKKWVAYTLNNNLFIASEKEEKIVVTNFSDENIVSGQAIHRKEFGISKGTFWSPNGNLLAFYQKNETNVSAYPMVDVTTIPASLKNIKYPMAGQKSERAAIGIFNPNSLKITYLDIDTSDEHYLTNLSWTPDEKYILVAEVNREQNQYWLNRYDVSTGKKINTLFTEKNEKWVEPENPAVFLPSKNDAFLWLSEKNGFMNVYLYNLDGKLIKQITNFKWVVEHILGFDTKEKFVFISGTGADPREKHCFKIELANPKKITQLTKEKGTHQTQLSSDGNFLIDQYESISIPNKIDVVTTENNQTRNLLTAKNPLENYKVATTELLEIKAEDGTTLYGKIHKPLNFNPLQKYPVLVYVYGGPHAQLVTNSWLGDSYLWLTAFAENEQYIVFTIDNRGSANRGFAFESSIHRNLGDAEIKDQLSGIAYLKSLPYVDTSRIAVHGWSFGGFMASSLLVRHPEIFKTAVAGGAVTDWNLYEVMYGERYMDTPQENPEGYKKSRVANYIENLKGKLLFIHGSTDDVVVPQHLLNLQQEATQKGKQIDMAIYPMHGHHISGEDGVQMTKRIIDYILTNNK